MIPETQISQYNSANLLVIIPTYNEAQNVPEIIVQIESVSPGAHILFVDDASCDGTAQHIKRHTDYLKKVFILERPEKLGLGSAYIDGFKWGLQKRQYDAICQMDADLSHNPQYLVPMMKHLETCDLVIGSRYVANGGVENWGVLRKCISRLGSIYAQFILGMKIKDLTGGFNLWRSQALEKLLLHKIRSEGYAFQVELKYRAYQKKFRIFEFPIIFKDRRVGKSKMSFKIFVEAFFRVLQMRIRDV